MDRNSKKGFNLIYLKTTLNIVPSRSILLPGKMFPGTEKRKQNINVNSIHASLRLWSETYVLRITKNRTTRIFSSIRSGYNNNYCNFSVRIIYHRDQIWIFFGVMYLHFYNSFLFWGAGGWRGGWRNFRGRCAPDDRIIITIIYCRTHEEWRKKKK